MSLGHITARWLSESNIPLLCLARHEQPARAIYWRARQPAVVFVLAHASARAKPILDIETVPLAASRYATAIASAYRPRAGLYHTF